MSYNEVHPYNYSSDNRSEFEKKGHPGKFFKSVTCSSGTTIFTGSNFGAGGIIIPAGTSGSVELSGGGNIPLTALSGSANAGTAIIELSVSSVTVNAGTVYVLLRNQLIR